MRFAWSLTLLALVGCGATSESPPDGASDWPAIETSEAIVAADIGRRIEILADDDFNGRAPGDARGERAADWIADEMRRIGLEPGVDGSYFQSVEMVTTTLDPESSRLVVRNGDATAELEPGVDATFWSKRQNATELAFDEAEMVFVGYGVVAPEYGWDDYAGVDARGKTVVMLVNDPGYATERADLFNGRAMTYYGRWTYKFEEAARQGAAAALVVHQTAPASYGWEVVAGSWSGPQFDLVRADGGAERTVLEGWISEAVSRRLFADAGLDFDALTAAASRPGFVAVPMGELSASGKLVQSVERGSSRNVAGIVRGSERPDEWVLLTAHWDHLGGVPQPDGGDGIYNGAVDNATGVAAALEIGEAFGRAAEPPQRSVMVLAVTLEESGLLGSAYFAENPVMPLASIVAGMNIDAMLPVGPTRDMVVVGYGASELEEMLGEILAADGRYIAPDPTPEAGYFYRSDHISLAKKGVPMLYADGGVEHVEKGQGFGDEMSQRYRANDYHKPSDEYDPAWDMSGFERDTRALYQLGRALADSERWPNWYPGNEFRALRDAQREAR